MKFTDLPRPFIVGVVSDADPGHCIRTIRLGEFDGADAFQLELHNLKPYPPTKRQMADIIGSTTSPVWTTNRRRRVESSSVRASEEDRVGLLLDSLDAGASCIDIEMDTFDPWVLWDQARRDDEWRRLSDIPVDGADFPHECSFDEKATRRQIELVDQVHSAGAEILMSCHVLVRARQDAVLKIADELVRRGADLVKIVVRNNDLYDLCDTLRTNVVLRERLKVPFKLMSQGEPSKIGRVVFPMFGSSWAFCQQDLRPGGFEYRPLISTEKFIMQHVDWRPNPRQHFKDQ